MVNSLYSNRLRAPLWPILLDLLDRTAGKRVLVVGDYMLDHYVQGDAERISPEAPVPVLRVVRREDTVGGAGSVAADIAALGATPICLGIVGEDEAGARLCELLTACGADATTLLRATDRPTTRKTRLVGLAQHRHRQQLIRIDEEMSHPVDAPTLDRLVWQLESLADSCDVLCIEDYDKGVVSQRLVQAASAAARRAGKMLFVDPAALPSYARYAGATLVTPNRTETERVCGLRLPDVEAVARSAKQIAAACGTEHVCVTLDVEGAALIGRDGSFEHLPTKVRDVYDVTGAGDAVLAALAVGVACGASLADAVALANVAGGLEVEKFGCVPIRREEIVAEILLEHHRELGKVRTLDQLLPELARRRARGERIAFTNGCFDLLHAGHVSLFAFASQHADLLVVGVNSDDSLRQLGKGESRPIVGQADRVVLLSALADVDYVVLFDEPTPKRLIEAIAPDVLVKGRDWQGRPVAGREFVESRGGRVLYAPLVDGRSTTNLIRRIREGAAQQSGSAKL